ncbi:hypothetical protein [Aeromonas media]|uniref:hypothetical protein n=1 Tax=Aeromonas media TaxID=651 RepID=UPI00384E6D36
MTITVNGVGGTSGSDQLIVRIVDDTPTAKDENGGSVTEDVAGSLNGNVLSNDTVGADTPAAFVGWSATGHNNSAAVTALSTYGNFVQKRRWQLDLCAGQQPSGDPGADVGLRPKL